jgi:hypothetical protein
MVAIDLDVVGRSVRVSQEVGPELAQRVESIFSSFSILEIV